jgi:hypothetical protein
MDFEQTQYYNICAGQPVAGNSLVNDGEFRRINEILFSMWQRKRSRGEIVPDGFGDYVEFDETRPYHLPDLRGLFLVGGGGGNQYYSKVQNIPVGSVGGNYEHKLTQNELPRHTHNHQTLNTGNDVFPGTASRGRGGWTTRTTEAQSSNEDAHNNMPPYFAVNYYMRVRV